MQVCVPVEAYNNEHMLLRFLSHAQPVAAVFLRGLRAIGFGADEDLNSPALVLQILSRRKQCHLTDFFVIHLRENGRTRGNERKHSWDRIA